MKLSRPLVIGGVWAFLGLIYSGQSFFYSLSVGREYLWQRSIFHSFVFCLEWGLLTPLVLRLADRFRLDDTKFLFHSGLHFSFGIGLALVQQSVYVMVTDFVDSGFVLTRSFFGYLPSIIGFFEYGVLMYWSIVFVYHAVGYYRRYRREEQQAIELRTQLAESQLQTLTMQLQPHFLFNTLNAISVLVKKEPLLAQKMIVRLSDLLRWTLERGGDNEISLDEEMNLLRTYLAIEKVRFGERLKVQIVIPESLNPMRVPTFILQPLVENSIRHGIARRSGEGWIDIVAAEEHDAVILTVTDGGTKPRRIPKSSEGFGVGLENTAKRISQLYGTHGVLEMKENDRNGYTVTIRLPKRSGAKIPTVRDINTESKR